MTDIFHSLNSFNQSKYVSKYQTGCLIYSTLLLTTPQLRRTRVLKMLSKINSSMSRVFNNGSGIVLQFFSADISKIHIHQHL